VCGSSGRMPAFCARTFPCVTTIIIVQNFKGSGRIQRFLVGKESGSGGLGPIPDPDPGVLKLTYTFSAEKCDGDLKIHVF
jgi:hypothetical protein